MSGLEGEVWLGDLAHAMDVLQVRDSETRTAIAALLGLAPATPRATLETPSQEPAVPLIRPTDRPFHEKSMPDPFDAPPLPLPEEYPLEEMPGLPLVVSAASRSHIPVPDWFEETSAYSPVDTVPILRAPYLPLFRPRAERAILVEMLSTTSRDGEMDLPRLLSGLLRGRPMRRLPRRPRRHLRRGVYLFADVSEGMAVYRPDQEYLLEQMIRLVGREWVQVHSFLGNPFRILQDDGTQSLVRLPPPGTPVLALTDLGLGASRPDTASAIWRNFATYLQEARCPLTVLVPYAERRWPSLGPARLVVLPWRTETQARDVARRRKKVALGSS